MNSLIFIAIVSMVALSKAEDSKEACETLIQCINDAISERKRCENITATIHAKWPPKLNERQQSIANKVIKVTEYEYTRRTEKAKCLQDALGNTTIVTCNKTATERCNGLVSSYKQPRAKRQATNATKAAEEKAKKEQAAKEAAAKAAAARQEREALQKELSQCQAAVSARDSKCSALAGCCSESWLCDLKWQQNPQAAEFAKLQYDLQIERRSVSCPPPPTPRPPTAAPAATTVAARRK